MLHVNMVAAARSGYDSRSWLNSMRCQNSSIASGLAEEALFSSRYARITSAPAGEAIPCFRAERISKMTPKQRLTEAEELSTWETSKDCHSKYIKKWYFSYLQLFPLEHPQFFCAHSSVTPRSSVTRSAQRFLQFHSTLHLERWIKSVNNG